MKLWQKDTDDAVLLVDKFTTGNDREMDASLAPFDVLGSLAHTHMLHDVGLLTTQDYALAKTGLQQLYKEVSAPNFTIPTDVEDIHSYVEFILTERIGDAGKKIHSARSRNDQVLLDVKLFLRHQIELLIPAIVQLFTTLQQKSELHKNDLLPGYTHLQLAMPSSFGLWLGAYAESLVDDVLTIKTAFDIVNKNPLGSAAGYGSSFPINRQLTTDLLGFDAMNYNVVYAQMGRGKVERILAAALANLADTLAKMSMDACLFMNQNFGFISFPNNLTTGSSIMPHKKNPDVFEIIRAQCNLIKALPNDMMMLTTNLPSGYHRDMQLLKEKIFPAFEIMQSCLAMMNLMMNNMVVAKDIVLHEKYAYLFSVEAVNRLVLQGVPFRDAYKTVGKQIDAGAFIPVTSVEHVHEGSIGNLCNEQIAQEMNRIVSSFPFDKINTALQKLL